MGIRLRKNFLVSSAYLIKTKVGSISLESRKVKNYLIYGNLLYYGMVLISLGAAIVTDRNLFSYPVSNLGYSGSTPIPFVFDIACVMAGILTMLLTIILSRSLVYEADDHLALRKILITVGMGTGIMGGIGYMFIGIFSLDRGGPGNIIYNISAGVTFLNFIISIISFSLCILLFQTKVKKQMGVVGLFGPLIFLIFWAIIEIFIFEWLLLFSIYGFSLPVHMKVLRN